MQYYLFIIYIQDVVDFLSFSLQYNSDRDKIGDWDTGEKSKKLRQTAAEIPVKQE